MRESTPKHIDVLLIHPPYHRRAGSGTMPPIGLAYVASALEALGLSVIIVDCALEVNSQTRLALESLRVFLQQTLNDIEPTLFVGIGPCTTPAIRSLLVVSETVRLRYPDAPLIFGGPFASLPEQIPVFFDLLKATAVVCGEAEPILPELISAVRAGLLGKPIRGVAWSPEDRPSYAVVSNLDKLSFPARHLLENGRYRPSLRRDVFNGPVTPIFLTRGCPYSCKFCASPLLRGQKRVGRRSLNSLTSEMLDCLHIYAVSGFIFYDDCLFVRSAHLNKRVVEFCNALVSLGKQIRWEMEMRCDALASLTNDSMNALWSAGCRQINLGIEKASDQMLQRIGKNVSASEIREACSRAKTTCPEIRLAGTFILGGPNETVDDIRQIVNFAELLPLDYAHFYPLELYPGTEYFAAKYQGQPATAWVNEVLADENNLWCEILFESPSLSKDLLIHLTQQAYTRFYGRREWLDRHFAQGSARACPIGVTDYR